MFILHIFSPKREDIVQVYIANMKDCWFLDNNLNGVSDEAFDVVGFFDFPIEDVEDDAVEEDWGAQFKQLEEPSLGVFSVSPSGLSDKTENENPKLGRSISTPVADPARPTYGNTIRNQNVSFNGKRVPKFQTYSPVSVFESSSSSSVENSNFDLPVIPVKRPRGKRRPLSSFSLLLSVPFVSNSPKGEANDLSESNLQTQADGKLISSLKKKQRSKDLPLLSDHTEKKGSALQGSVTHRKCMHCEVTSTPQWREGPMGPKTLCNACGVRYRSGRLFPEYRPAASPTFVPSLHSNSHRKVIEMRSRTATETLKGSSMLDKVL
ncbi:GATA transcription factor 11 isoform X1 [Arachis ipaensis]|uniref:GATA transcription factor 11 isoform X1 n=2 Tax=Arachis ipaensis TaxID=130454 RepID=UPI000A2B3DD7|nr:GATA transcription factor 11 isoform X1 [Arachis ipaensis]